MHYAHRAVLSPLLLAPKRAKIHASVAATAVLFNLLNATLQAGALSSYPPPGGWTFWAGVALWASAFAGNGGSLPSLSLPPPPSPSPLPL